MSDARNDAALEGALTRLPRGCALVFRHYHLDPHARRARWLALRRLAAARGHLAILAGNPHLARRWGADGVYGPWHGRAAARGLLRVASAHDASELARANRAGVDVVMLSPVFATRSHPGGQTLGPVRFRLLAARARMPVIALGGMCARAARRLGWPRWAAIDGLAGGSGADS